MAKGTLTVDDMHASNVMATPLDVSLPANHVYHPFQTATPRPRSR